MGSCRRGVDQATREFRADLPNSFHEWDLRLKIHDSPRFFLFNVKFKSGVCQV